MVFTLVEAADDVFALPGDRADASVWRRIFLNTGGMRHLLALLREGGGIDPSQVFMCNLCSLYCKLVGECTLGMSKTAQERPLVLFQEASTKYW